MTLKLPVPSLEAWPVSIVRLHGRLFFACTFQQVMPYHAGAMTAFAVCPLDVLKTRLQVQGRAQAVAYKGIGGLLQLQASC